MAPFCVKTPWGAGLRLIGDGRHGRDIVEVGVIWDDGSLQAEYDKKYGTGTVQVWSALQPF
jgi:hypothetical protein